MQASAEVSPLDELQVPFGQAVHSRASPSPGLAAQRPAGHTEQEPGPGAPACALHRPTSQAWQTVARSASRVPLKVPGRHGVHAVEPAALQVPAPQTVHWWRSGRGKPWPAGQAFALVAAPATRKRTRSARAMIGHRC